MKRNNTLYEYGVFDNEKHLKTIVEGIICGLIISGESYIKQDRLIKAINQYFVDRNIEFDKSNLTKPIDNVMTDLYKCHRIIPDVINGNGFIISSDNSVKAQEAVDEFVTRSNVTFRPYPTELYGFARLYSRDEAKGYLNKCDEKSKDLSKTMANNYRNNYMDIREVFTL